MHPAQLKNQETSLRRRRTLLRSFIALIIIATLSFTAWIYFKELEPGVPLLNNVVVFALVNLSIILLMVVILLVAKNLVRLYYEGRTGAGRSRLQLKLVLAFVGFTLIPVVALFVVASGLINQSFNALFNMNVERALKGSFEVAQTYYREVERNALFSASRLALMLEKAHPDSLENPKAVGKILESERKSLGVDFIQLYDRERKEIVSVKRPGLGRGAMFSPLVGYVDQVIDGESRSSIENWEKGDVIYGVAPLRIQNKVVGFIVVSKYVSDRLVEKIRGISDSFVNYKELELSKNPIKANYIITFLVVTLLILFAAIWFGFYLARGITVPIEKLADATRAVSDGDLEHRVDAQADGEVGILVNAFNSMTEELLANKEKIEESSEILRRSNMEIDRRRRYMEAMLENIGAGVISINRRGRVTILNKAAGELLSIEPQNAVGRLFSEIFESAHLEPVRQLMRSMRNRDHQSASEQVEVMIDGRVLTLRASLTLLKSADGGRLGAVIVFDDMTALIRAQKVAAWQEVARGIAHEIKNPLTPIQLSAQRMRRKFEIEAYDFAEVFESCTDTIINQVTSLIEMVNEFSRFARMPEPRLRLCEFVPLIEDVANLYRDRKGNVKFSMQIDTGNAVVMADPEQLQRVFINLLENAFESHEVDGEIDLQAWSNMERNMIVVEVADQGQGISEDMKGHIFSPYFSTKDRGSGLGLAICHRIVADHNGTIGVRDNHPVGSVFRVTLPLAPTVDITPEKQRTAFIG